MPTKSNDRGSFLIEKSYRGMKKPIRRASGTDNRKTFRLILAMLDNLYQLGRLDLLERIRQGTLKPLELYAKYRLGAFDRLPTADGIRNLREAAKDFVASHECSASHRKNISQYLAGYTTRGYEKRPPVWKDGILLVGEPDDTAVEELPRLLSEYRERCRLEEHPTSFRTARTISLAFIRRTLSRHHPLWYEIADVELLKVVRGATHPFTVGEALQIQEKLGGATGAAFMTMCLTGMGPREFWGKWEVRPDRVSIHGTKRKARERAVPLVGAPTPPPLSYGRFSKTFREAFAELNMSGVLYDCRRAYATWLVHAKIPRARRKMYLGHSVGSGDITDLYEAHEVAAFLEADGRQLQAYVDSMSELSTKGATGMNTDGNVEYTKVRMR